jgi:hypothetical protein
MFEHFMVITGWLFWLVLGVFVVAEIAATENDNLFLAIVLAIVALVVFSVGSDHNPVRWVVDNPLHATLSIPLYFLFGTVWAYWKWHGVIVDALAQYKKVIDANHDASKDNYRPSAANSKERIVTWIIMWPFSMFWALLTWPRRLATAIYNRLAASFQHMADEAFS